MTLSGPLTVLVVDDDFHVAQAHALAVSRIHGFAVAGEAHSCAQAIHAAAELDPHLILLDMYLPDGSGLDVIRTLSAAGHDLPEFLPVTAARDIDSVRTAMQLGAFYYLVKPFTFASLREQLEAYRAWHTRLTSTATADQEVVNELYELRGHRSNRPLDRPLPPTMTRVLRIVTSSATPLSAADVAERLGASRPTAQRYLAILVRRRLLDLDLSYGTTGRPEHRYQPARPHAGTKTS
jgi:response regulator of citrate/malate metabolism